MNLAQINISRMLDKIDSPTLASFVAQLDTVNALAEGSPGFVWRLKDEGGNATEINAFDDDLIIVNMSVWKSVDDLKNFAFKTFHSDVMRRRTEWFEKFKTAYVAMWWIPEGHIPTIDEAKEKLALLDLHGDTADAFTFKKIFEAPV
jgi:Domain of unknown function (DUF3291)